MNILEKQSEFGRTFFEINQNAFQEFTRTQQENWKNYFELNADFGKKLPEVKDISTFMELQREYGQTLWSGFKDATTEQAGIVKTAVTETGEAVRKVFSPEVAD